MEPVGPAPWRALEVPADGDASAVSSPAAPARPDQTAQERSGLPRLLLIAGAAIACGLAAFVLAAGSGRGSFGMQGGSALESSGSAAVGGDVAVASQASGELIVEVVGAVRRPGVYRMAMGSRVGDAVDRAGGYSPRVDTTLAEQQLNLAAPLHDGDQIRVPARGEAAAPPSSGGGTARGSGGLVDLNHATQSELEALPGIGPATAEKIIAAREEAPFNAVEELRSRGILGEKTFEKLRELVTVG